MLSESGSLILSTTSTTNPCTINASKSDFTFSNINMRNVLGEAWDKYEMFTMKVVTAAITGTMTLANTSIGIFVYNMAGLTWENLHYDTAYMSQNYVAIATFNAQVAGNSSQQNQLISNTGQSYNFRKCGDLVDLNFTTTTTNNTGGPSTFGVAGGANVYCDVAFHLVFEPVIPGEMNECAFFGFNTASNITSQVGRTISADRKEFNYSAFDMRRLCRNFWDKHEDFEIQMSFYNVVGAGSITQNNRVCNFQMNGLNFVNSATKNSSSTDRLGITTESPIVATIVFPLTASNHDAVMAYPVAPIQFKKDEDNVNLTITMKNSENSGPFAFTFGGVNPACVIGFFVKPIYKVEKATLFINPFGLTTTETNLGITNTQQTQFTLNNINMRQVCRSMWDKYKKFNIFLTGTTSFQAAAQAVNGAYILQMEGFDFINQTAYITGTGQTQTATLGIVSMGSVAGTPRTNGWQSGIVTTFYRNQDFVNLTLRALPIAPGSPFTNFPLVCNFTFTIVGIPEDEEQSKQFKENWMRIA
jgi:hypothetical protein